MKPDHILVPTDLSAEMEQAYAWADWFGKNALTMRTTLLHMPPMPAPGGNFLRADNLTAEFLDQYLNKARLVLENHLDRDWPAGMKVNAELISSGDNNLGDGMTRFQKDKAADFAILFSNHRNAGNLGGSRLIQVIRSLNIPAMIPGKNQLPGVSRIAFATDFSRPAMLVYRDLAEFAKRCGATLLPFFVNTPGTFLTQKEFREKSIGFLRDAGIRDRSLLKMINSWSVETGILEFSDDNLCDLVALTWQDGDGILPGPLINAITENLVAHSALNLLVFQAPRIRAIHDRF